jgi:hypothetical protein
VAHVLLLAPMIVLAGLLLGRLVPARPTPYFQAGLILGGVVTWLLPFVLGYGRTPDLPSALPLNYGRGLLVILALIWLIIGLVALVRERLRRGQSQPSMPDAGAAS